MSEYLYALEFSNNLVKVGKTKNIEQRIKTHVKNVSDTAGACLVNQWHAKGVSDVSHYEKQLIRFCNEKWLRRSREWFVGADFNQVVEFASSLHLTSDFCDSGAKYSGVTLKMWLERCRAESLDLAISAKEGAEYIQDWIIDSGLDMSIFEVQDKLIGLSPFVALFTTAIYNFGYAQVVETIHELALGNYEPEVVDSEFNKVYTEIAHLMSSEH